MQKSTLESEASQDGSSALWQFLAAFAGAWLVHALTSRFPGYVHHDTAELAMWANVGFEWGYQKHPPLLAWMAGLASKVAPLGFASFSILSVLNLTISAFAVYKVADLAIGRARAPLAMALHLASPFATVYALKLNHNSVLISLWPLCVWAFLLLFRTLGLRQGLVLGALSGLAMLAKLQSGLLLASFGVAVLASKDRWRLLASPAPYLAALVCAAMVAPHLIWLATTNANDLDAGLMQRAEKGLPPSRLLLSNIAGSLPMLAVTGVLTAWLGRGDNDAGTEVRRVLALLFVVPYVLTVAIVMALGLRGSATWTMPIFLLLPVLLASFIRPPTPEQTRKLDRLGLAALALVAAAGFPLLAVSFKRGEDSADDSRQELAAKAAAVWQQATGRAPRIIAGSHRLVMAGMIAVPGRPLGWSEPRSNRPYWITDPDLARSGVLAICHLDDAACGQLTAPMMLKNSGLLCRVSHRRRLLWMTAPEAQAQVFIVPGTDATAPLRRPAGCEASSPRT